MHGSSNYATNIHIRLCLHQAEGACSEPRIYAPPTSEKNHAESERLLQHHYGYVGYVSCRCNLQVQFCSECATGSD